VKWFLQHYMPILKGGGETCTHDTRAHLYDGGPFAQGQILLREEKRIVQTCFGIRFSGFGVSGSGFRFRILSKCGQVSGFQVDRVSGIR
jgi:hypothetical protein